MRFGVCCGPELAAKVAQAGFDYFEGGALRVTAALQDDDAFKPILEQVRSAPLSCEAVNGFIPAEIRVTGPTADLGALERYVTTVFARAAKLGVTRVVFGSAGARNVPDGFDPSAAWDQMIAGGKMMAPLAEAQGITIALEPLRTAESNIINTVAQGADLVRQIGHPAFCLLVDGYHWGQNAEPAANIIDNGKLLVHAHVATDAHRQAPGSEPCRQVPEFFRALKAAGYDQRVSIEGRIPNPDEDLPRALELMRELSIRS